LDTKKELMPMLRPAAPMDPLSKLRDHAAQALALLDGVRIEPHPSARAPRRRQANQAAHALVAARRELARLVGLLGP
jgi:hypothetical protein